MPSPDATPTPAGNAALVLDKYAVIRRLAIGGMGEVFLARQVGGFERHVILKNLLPELAQQADFVEQFLDEARVISNLNHPNIVSVYEVGIWQGVHFLAMEYIHGTDISALMRAAIKRRLAVPVSVAARIIRDAALGLDHAHRARDVKGRPLGIVHRDISPQNIMVRQDGVTKVVDFGIAKASNKASRTQTGALKGKLQYMAPEQLNGETLDGRADQFALGIVFWEMCARKRLFKGGNELETFEMILQRPYPVLSTVTDVPAPISDIVMRMLARNPADRFPDCAHVAEELAAYLSTLSREVGESLVADVVKELVGTELEERLSGTGHGPVVGLNGVISGPQASLTPSRPGEAATRPYDKIPQNTEPLNRPRKSHNALWAGLAALTVTVGVGGGVVWTMRPPTLLNEQAVVPPPAPPVPVTPPPAADPLVTIESSPGNAAVWLGREAMGTTPVVLSRLRPDVDYQFTVELRGYEPQEIRVRAAAGEKVLRSVKLLKLPEKKPPPHGTSPGGKHPGGNRAPDDTNAMGVLSLRTVPWVKLFVDDKPMGQTPVYRLQVPAGRHKLRMVNEAAGVDETRTIDIPGNGQVSETWKLKG